MLLLLSKSVAATDLGSTLCAAALASPQLLLPDAPLESCMTGGPRTSGSSPGSSSGSSSRSSSWLSVQRESARRSSSVLGVPQTQPVRSTKSIAVEPLPAGCPSQYVRRRPMVFIPIACWEHKATTEQRAYFLLAMAAYEKFVTVADRTLVRLPGIYTIEKRLRSLPRKRRLLFDVLHKRINALIDWVYEAEELNEEHAAELDRPYAQMHIDLAKSTACGMMLAIAQMFDLEWPLVVEPSSDGRDNFVYNDVAWLLELFSNSRAPALPPGKNYYTRYEKTEGAEPLPGGLDPLSNLMGSAPKQSPYWALPQWTKDYMESAEKYCETERHLDALERFGIDFGLLVRWHRKTGVEPMATPVLVKDDLRRFPLRELVELLLRYLAWAVGALESEKNALMRLLTPGRKGFEGLEQQTFLESIYVGQRLACLLAKTLIILVTEEQNVPDTVYYRYIPLLLETLARTCNVWPEVEEELSLGKWTADDCFKAQLLATAVSQLLVQPGIQPAPTQNGSPPAQTYLPFQSLFQLLVPLGTQPSESQSTAVVQNTVPLQDEPLDLSKDKSCPPDQTVWQQNSESQSTAVVQNTVPLQDEPLDLSKNKSCPPDQTVWQQNPADQMACQQKPRTPPPPYEGRHTVKSNVHQQFSYGNTCQHPHLCTGQCVPLHVPLVQQLPSQYAYPYLSQYVYPAHPSFPVQSQRRERKRPCATLREEIHARKLERSRNGDRPQKMEDVGRASYDTGVQPQKMEAAPVKLEGERVILQQVVNNTTESTTQNTWVQRSGPFTGKS